MRNQIFNEDCLQTMSRMSDRSIDLVVTSPPYDNLRSYGNNVDQTWGESVWKPIISDLCRVIKDGGVIVWVVGDATVNGSETGSSFKQALYFKECGLNLYDTMIWTKSGRIPTQDRYYNVFEYMFVFSKGAPSSLNFIVDHKNVSAGQRQRKDAVINKGKNRKKDGEYFTRKEYSRRGNVWYIPIGSTKGTGKHPATFPESLARDHIISWSNKGDLVYDPFLGSGTTAKTAMSLKRDYVGSELNGDYFKIAQQRITNVQISLF